MRGCRELSAGQRVYTLCMLCVVTFVGLQRVCCANMAFKNRIEQRVHGHTVVSLTTGCR